MKAKKQPVEVVVGPDAVDRLVQFCRKLPHSRLTLVSDDNTYRVLGGRVEDALRGAGLDVLSIVLHGDEVAADEKRLVEVLVQAPAVPQTFIAVGSGTLTDIARYVSFRTGNDFISVPTAASVDGFLSVGAPLIVGGLKETFEAQGPAAVFADLPTLMAAPRELTAAGFGDIIGKATSLADWELGGLLWDEPYVPEIAARTRAALDLCIEQVDAIRDAAEPGLRSLFDALIESGACMLDLGNSRPASGSEHHCSHYWEMLLLRDNRPAILHGAKVGYAAMLVAQLYAYVRTLSQDDVARLLDAAPVLGPEEQVAEIRAAYGSAADGIIRLQKRFLDLTSEDTTALGGRILEAWPAIQEIAASVPPAVEIKRLLDHVGAPTDWYTLGLDVDQVQPGLLYGHYLRDRFTVLKLFRMLGLDVRSIVQAP